MSDLTKAMKKVLNRMLMNKWYATLSFFPGILRKIPEYIFDLEKRGYIALRWNKETGFREFKKIKDYK